MFIDCRCFLGIFICDVINPNKSKLANVDFNPLRDKLFSNCPNSLIFCFFSITCEFNSKFDTKFVLAIIFLEKITLKIAHFPIDLYS